MHGPIFFGRARSLTSTGTRSRQNITCNRLGARWLEVACASLFGAIDSYKIGPSIAMALFQSRRVTGHWPTISAVTG